MHVCMCLLSGIPLAGLGSVVEDCWGAGDQTMLPTQLSHGTLLDTTTTSV